MSDVTFGGLLCERFGKLACFETVGIPFGPGGIPVDLIMALDTVGMPTGLVSSGSGDEGLEEAKLGGGLCLGRWSSELELRDRTLRGEGVSNLCSAGLL